MADQKVLALSEGVVTEVTVAAGGGSGGLPYYVPNDGDVSLPEFAQTPVFMRTKLDGIIKNDGFIIEVL